MIKSDLINTIEFDFQENDTELEISESKNEDEIVDDTENKIEVECENSYIPKETKNVLK